MQIAVALLHLADRQDPLQVTLDGGDLDYLTGDYLAELTMLILARDRIQQGLTPKMLARQFRMPAVDLSKFEVDPRIAKLIPSDLATKHLVLPLKRDGRTLTVAMADPTNLGVIDDLKFITRYDIFPVIAGELTLRNAIETEQIRQAYLFAGPRGTGKTSMAAICMVAYR